jgi:hypothetical protein
MENSREVGRRPTRPLAVRRRGFEKVGGSRFARDATRGHENVVFVVVQNITSCLNNSHL